MSGSGQRHRRQHHRYSLHSISPVAALLYVAANPGEAMTLNESAMIVQTAKGAAPGWALAIPILSGIVGTVLGGMSTFFIAQWQARRTNRDQDQLVLFQVHQRLSEMAREAARLAMHIIHIRERERIESGDAIELRTPIVPPTFNEEQLHRCFRLDGAKLVTDIQKSQRLLGSAVDDFAKLVSQKKSLIEMGSHRPGTAYTSKTARDRQIAEVGGLKALAKDTGDVQELATAAANTARETADRCEIVWKRNFKGVLPKGWFGEVASEA